MFIFCIILAIFLVVILIFRLNEYGIPEPSPESPGNDVLISEYTVSLGEEVLSFTHYRQMDTYNGMRMCYNSCYCRSPSHTLQNSNDSSVNTFIVITNFHYLDPKSPKNSKMIMQDGLKVNESIIAARNMEVINVLASNLNHRSIEEIHILVQKPEVAEYLRRLPIENSQKVVIQVMEASVEMKTQIDYAGQCLNDTIVAISHQDNLYGKGWDKLRPEILRKKRLLYSITRHTSGTVPCKGSNIPSNCDPGTPYVGSHDVFMYHVKEKFSAERLKPMEEVTPNIYGMENVLMFVFRVRLNYTILNPCQVLIVHHQHCISVREPGRIEIGWGEKGRARHFSGFTDKLE